MIMLCIFVYRPILALDFTNNYNYNNIYIYIYIVQLNGDSNSVKPS